MSIENTIKVKKEEGTEAIYQFLSTVEELKKCDGQLTKWIDDHDILLYEFEGDEVYALVNFDGTPVRSFVKDVDKVHYYFWNSNS